jgi:hypothetical protein
VYQSFPDLSFHPPIQASNQQSAPESFADEKKVDSSVKMLHWTLTPLGAPALVQYLHTARNCVKMVSNQEV